jgi:deazaflavin-dependent oxidoreductase (nitroreductase family)
MSGIRRLASVALVVAFVAGVVVLLAMVLSRRVVLRDQLVLDRSRPYIHRNTFLRRVVNPIMLLLASRDRTPGGRTIAVLVVPGRRSGKPRRVPMDPPFEHGGQRYLVSPSGDTHWARNLRAAGEAELCLDGRAERIRVVELEGSERDAIVTAYAAGLTCDCRIGMAKLPDPSDHPTFRIEPYGQSGPGPERARTTRR